MQQKKADNSIVKIWSAVEPDPYEGTEEKETCERPKIRTISRKVFLPVFITGKINRISPDLR
jgi:hypothetical protein